MSGNSEGCGYPVYLAILTLNRGKPVVSVPGQAIGFTLQTPPASIVDLDTEFGVEVSDNCQAEVAVTSGIIQITSAANPPSRLTAGQMVRFADSGAIVERAAEASTQFDGLMTLARSGLSQPHDLWVYELFSTSRDATPLNERQAGDGFQYAWVAPIDGGIGGFPAFTLRNVNIAVGPCFPKGVGFVPTPGMFEHCDPSPGLRRATCYLPRAVDLSADGEYSLGYVATKYGNNCHGTWMMSILPYIEASNLYTQYKGLGTFGNPQSTPEKPYYFDPINLSVTRQRLSYATCPSDFMHVVYIQAQHSQDVGLPPVDAALTLHNYGVNLGNTRMQWRRAWGSVQPQNATNIYEPPYGYLVAGKQPNDNPMPDGSVYLGAPFEPRVEATFASIRDGSSQTLLLSEFITAQQNEQKASNHIDARGLTWWGDGSGFSTYLPPNASAPDITTFSSYCLADISGNSPCDYATDARVAVYYGPPPTPRRRGGKYVRRQRTVPGRPG